MERTLAVIKRTKDVALSESWRVLLVLDRATSEKMTIPIRMIRTMKSKTTAASVVAKMGLELGVIVARRVMMAVKAIWVAVESTASPKAVLWAVPSLREKAIGGWMQRGASITKRWLADQKSDRSDQDPDCICRIHGIDNLPVAASFPRIVGGEGSVEKGEQ